MLIFFLLGFSTDQDLVLSTSFPTFDSVCALAILQQCLGFLSEFQVYISKLHAYNVYLFIFFKLYVVHQHVGIEMWIPRALAPRHRGASPWRTVPRHILKLVQSIIFCFTMSVQQCSGEVHRIPTVFTFPANLELIIFLFWLQIYRILKKNRKLLQRYSCVAVVLSTTPLSKVCLIKLWEQILDLGQ